MTQPQGLQSIPGERKPERQDSSQRPHLLRRCGRGLLRLAAVSLVICGCRDMIQDWQGDSIPTVEPSAEIAPSFEMLPTENPDVILKRILRPEIIQDKDKMQKSLDTDVRRAKATLAGMIGLLDRIPKIDASEGEAGVLKAVAKVAGTIPNYLKELKSGSSMERALKDELPMIKHLSEMSGLPPAAVAAFIRIESDGNPDIMSYGGAAGRFQHILRTAIKAGEVVGYREGQNDGTSITLDDETKVTIDRLGDYEVTTHTENGEETRYYPVEDGRLGFEHWAGTANILHATYAKRNGSWINSAIYYHDGIGYKSGKSLASYLLLGPHPLKSKSPFGYKKEKGIQRRSVKTRRYVIKYLFALQGAAAIDWDSVEAYTPEHTLVETPEDITLYDLITSHPDYTLLDLVDTTDPNAPLNNQFSFFRIALNELSSDVQVPENCKRRLQDNFIDPENHYVVKEVRDLGFDQQLKDGEKGYHVNPDDTCTVEHDDFKEQERPETRLKPEFLWMNRGTHNTPTLDDVRRAGFPMHDIIISNPDMWGLNGKPMDPAIKQHLKTTHVKKGTKLEVRKEKVAVVSQIFSH